VEVSCYHIQIAVSVKITQGDCIGSIIVQAYICAADTFERIRTSIVQIKCVGPFIISRHHIQVAVSVNITQGD